MHDEATPDYRDMITQTDLGLTYLKNLFNITPKTGWQIDPFGHGSTTPTILSKFGYTSVILNRISTVEKQALQKGNLNFFWYGDRAGENNNMLFTHMLYGHYCQE